MLREEPSAVSDQLDKAILELTQQQRLMVLDLRESTARQAKRARGW
jgi:hypothetical protein